MRFFAALGKFLISVGVGILLFLAWVMWGTGIYTERRQEALAAEFAREPLVVRGDRRGPQGPPKGFAPGPGEPVFRLRIPAIDLSRIVVEGVGVEQLRTGPGHYPSCRDGFVKPLCTELDEVYPGERGRAIVSGHRTTYGAPFWDLDKLSRRDDIITETSWGDFVYEVTDKEIVPPSSRDIANPAATNGSEIVLTTCNPKFSAAERLIVIAEMERAQ